MAALHSAGRWAERSPRRHLGQVRLGAPEASRVTAIVPRSASKSGRGCHAGPSVSVPERRAALSLFQCQLLLLCLRCVRLEPPLLSLLLRRSRKSPQRGVRCCWVAGGRPSERQTRRGLTTSPPPVESPALHHEGSAMRIRKLRPHRTLRPRQRTRCQPAARVSHVDPGCLRLAAPAGAAQKRAQAADQWCL